jgi:hypothetical protein
MLRTVAGRPGWRRLLVSYFLAASLRVPGQQRRGRDREDFRPAPARDEPGERGEPGPVAGFVPHSVGVPAQHGVLVPEHQQFGVLLLVPAGHQDDQAE